MSIYLDSLIVLTKIQLKEIWDNNPIKFYIEFMSMLLDEIDGGIWNKIFAMIFMAVYPITIVPIITLVVCVPVFLLNILELILIPFDAISLTKEYNKSV
jgi:hypothetical protein